MQSISWLAISTLWITQVENPFIHMPNIICVRFMANFYAVKNLGLSSFYITFWKILLYSIDLHILTRTLNYHNIAFLYVENYLYPFLLPIFICLFQLICKHLMCIVLTELVSCSTVSEFSLLKNPLFNSISKQQANNVSKLWITLKTNQ